MPFLWKNKLPLFLPQRQFVIFSSRRSVNLAHDGMNAIPVEINFPKISVIWNNQTSKHEENF